MPSVWYNYSASAQGTGDGSSLANAYSTFQAALSGVLGKTADGTPLIIWVPKTSAETLPSSPSTIVSGSTAATKVYVISVATGAANPPSLPGDFAPGASISAPVNIGFSMWGFIEWCGVSLTLASGANSAGPTFGNSGAVADVTMGLASSIVFSSTGGASQVNIGAAAVGGGPHRLTLKGDPNQAGAARTQKTKFSLAAHGINLLGGALLSIRDNALLLNPGAPGIANLITYKTLANTVDCDAVDFTGLTGNLFVVNATAGVSRADIRDSVGLGSAKLLAGATTLAGLLATPLPPGSRLAASRCQAGVGPWSCTVVTSEGGQMEDGALLMTGGASDGANARSWHIAPNGVATPTTPYETNAITVFDQQTAAGVTVAIEGIMAGATLPTNKDISLQVEFPTASGAQSITNAATSLILNSAPVAHQASSAAWTGQAAGNVTTTYTTFRMLVTLPAKVAGPIKAIVKTSGVECWINPVPIVSGGPAVSRSFLTSAGIMASETAATIAGPTQYLPAPGGRSPFGPF